MGKLVVLKLDGNLEQQGFRVNLEICQEEESSDGEHVASRPLVETSGYLPSCPDLADQLQRHWLEKYRRVSSFNQRLKPKRIFSGKFPQSSSNIQACYDSADELRACLENWFNAETFRPIDRRLREILNRDEAARLLVRTDDPHLQKIPWHLWDLFERYPNVECALSAQQFEHSVQQIASVNPVAKVRVLAILGHSDGIDVEADRQLLEMLPDAETVFLVEPNRQQLNDQLWEQPWDILFFAGHSETDGDTGRIYINANESLTVNELWYALRKTVERGLKLAIFNSCDGLGLAHQLDDLQIPQMIVMRELVPDRVAQEFLKHFLKAFSGGQSFYLAVRQARERLQGLESQFPCASWLPVIYQNPAEVPPTWEKVKTRGKRSRNLLLNKWQVGWVAASLLVGLGWVGWHWAAPQLATVFNNRGFQRYLAGKLTQSQEALALSLQLDANNRVALYNQAWQCEAVRDFVCAEEKYREAAKLGLPAAHSNLARLEIVLKQDYGAAAALSWQGLRLEPDESVEYSLRKNLGWARLGQERYEEAAEQLQAAVRLDRDRAPAHCLLAQVLDAQGKTQSASVEWEICLRAAIPGHPDEDNWIDMGQKRLNAAAKNR